MRQKARLQISMSSNIASSRHLLPLVRPWARDYDDRVRLGDYLRERGFEWFAGVCHDSRDGDRPRLNEDEKRDAATWFRQPLLIGAENVA